jgi:uncharacterized protein YkwD
MMKQMMIKTFFLSVSVVVAMLFVPDNASAQKQGAYNDMAKEILQQIKKYRAGKGLNPLMANEMIAKEAETHSRNMASKKVAFSHDGFDKRAERIRKQLRTVNSWAENVAFGASTAREAVEMWLSSSGHKKNIEGNYNFTGIGIAKGANGSLYFTQIFVQKN